MDFFFSIGTRPCNFNMGVVNLLEFGNKKTPKKKLRYSPMESLQPNLFVYIWVSWCIQMKLWANVPDFVLEPVAEKPRFLLLRLNCFGLLMRQRNSPGRISQIKVNSISEIASCRSAVNSWVLHVQVERLAVRLGKSEQQHGDTKERAGEKGCYPRRLYAKSSRTHFFFFQNKLIH